MHKRFNYFIFALLFIFSLNGKAVYAAAVSDDEVTIDVASSSDVSQWPHFFGNATIKHTMVGAGEPSVLAHRFFCLEYQVDWQLKNAGYNDVDVSGDYPGLLACALGYVSVQKEHEGILEQVIAGLEQDASQNVSAFEKELSEAKKKVWRANGSRPDILNILKHMIARPFFARVQYDQPKFKVNECKGRFWQTCPGEHCATATSNVQYRKIGPYEQKKDSYNQWIDAFEMSKDVERYIPEWTFLVTPGNIDEDALTMPFECSSSEMLEALKQDKAIPQGTPMAIVRFNKDALHSGQVVQRLSDLPCREDKSFDLFSRDGSRFLSR